MILIISIASDNSTCKVIDFLIQKRKKYFRINDFIKIVNISVTDGFFEVEVATHLIINSTEIKAVWHRKGELKLLQSSDNIRTNPELTLLQEIKKNERIENKFLIDLIYSNLESKRKIGAPSFSNFNKLNNLKLARDLGILIPKSFIFTNKNDVIKKFHPTEKIITKAISESFSHISDIIALSYTELIYPADLPSTFAPSLVQSYIEKEYEIRSFFIDDKYYSMATFVLDNCIDNVDIRKPNLQNQINIPYKLPTFFEEKLSKLMDILGLNTGSFDIIKGTDSNLYFLEINPVGIFDNVSYYCNYYLEKKIADYLYT